VPMFELPAGREDKRKFCVGLLVRRRELGCDKLSESSRTRKALIEHHVMARLVWSIRWIRHCALAVDPIPGNIVEGRHQRSHLGIEVARMCIIPVKADAARDLLGDPPVGPRVSW